MISNDKMGLQMKMCPLLMLLSLSHFPPSIHVCTCIQVFDFAVSRPGVQFDVFMGAGGFGANNGCAGNPLAAYDYSPSSFFYTTAPDGNKGQVGYSNYQADCAKLGTVSA